MVYATVEVISKVTFLQVDPHILVVPAVPIVSPSPRAIQKECFQFLGFTVKLTQLKFFLKSVMVMK